MIKKCCVNAIAASMIFGLASLSAAQDSPPARSMIIGNIGKSTASPSYFIYLGKIIFKKTKRGVTVFSYADGKVASEKRSDGVVGTYIYDRAGRFEAITYSDGRTLTGDEAKKEYKILLQVQERASTLAGKNPAFSYSYDPVCEDDTPTPTPCVVEVDGGEGTGGGYEGGWDGGAPSFPEIGGILGGIGGGGVDTPFTPPLDDAHKDPERCKATICVRAGNNFDHACGLITAPGGDGHRRCLAVSHDFFNRCLKSCTSGDWAWLGDVDYFN